MGLSVILLGLGLCLFILGVSCFYVYYFSDMTILKTDEVRLDFPDIFATSQKLFRIAFLCGVLFTISGLIFMISAATL